MPEFDTRLLSNESIRGMSDEGKQKIGQLVSNALMSHASTMLQYTAQEVGEIMSEGRAVVGLDVTESVLHGFAQLSPWLDQESTVRAIEFRSWIATVPGAGLPVLRGGVELSRDLYPDVPIYAVIEDANAHAQQLVLVSGGLEVQMPDAISIELKAGDELAAVRTFDLAAISPNP